jgi:hypothetical protein
VVEYLGYGLIDIPRITRRYCCPHALFPVISFTRLGAIGFYISQSSGGWVMLARLGAENPSISLQLLYGDL